MTQGAVARKCHPKPPERQDVLEALRREPLRVSHQAWGRSLEYQNLGLCFRGMPSHHFPSRVTVMDWKAERAK